MTARAHACVTSPLFDDHSSTDVSGGRGGFGETRSSTARCGRLTCCYKVSLSPRVPRCRQVHRSFSKAPQFHRCLWWSRRLRGNPKFHSTLWTPQLLWKSSGRVGGWGPWDDGPANYIPKSAVPCEHAYGRKLYQNSLDRQTEQKFWFGFPSVAILAQVQPIRAAGARASTGLELVDTARPSAFARRICSFRSAASLANHARQWPHARRFHLQRGHQRLRKGPVA